MSLADNRITEEFDLSTARHAPRPGAEELREYVVTHIDEAVEQGWIVPYYQPVIRTLTGKLCGCEALARWEDPQYGLLTPDLFIGALEDARLIHLLDISIIRQICRQYRESVDEGVPVTPISFNLSRLDFELCEILDIIEEAVREYEVPRRMLNIEITESVLGSDPVFMNGMMGQFHAVGYQVWMDDFGSGYSNLNVLKDFDFDELKLDMEFLNRFGEKSKTILASVVDMAKKLGIQTLAEGVETEEQHLYLRRIGCEKMQGYLFGRPQKYNVEATLRLCDEIGIETAAEQIYYREIGGMNTLSLSERDLTAGNNTRDYVTSMPLAIMEYEDGRFSFLDSNRVFRESLANMGIPSEEEAERRLNDPRRTIARQARRLVSSIRTDEFARLDFVEGEISCVLRARHITSRDGKTALLVSVDDTIGQGERKRHERQEEALSVMYSIYEHIDVIHLDEGFIEPVFDNAGFESHYHVPVFSDVTRHFAEAEIYPADRERYIAYMEHDTMVKRIKESGENYLVGFFRVRQEGADYAWKLFVLINLTDRPGNQVMLCIRGTHWTNDGLFQAAFDDDKLDDVNVMENDLSITDGSLWRAVASDDEFAFFWKDRDRRFMGANQAFLDYYGFDSIDAVKGKTDEDMGWHIDPLPFMEDELRVLNEGITTKDKVGQCIVRGEVRDIVATKRPVYRNGRIVGLVGDFIDAETKLAGDDAISSLPLRDSVTGVLNFTGLESATFKFIDAYNRFGTDFAMISVNVEDFDRINEAFGYEFGEKVLKKVADVLKGVAGQNCAVGHVHSFRFVVLAQDDDEERLQGMCDEIEQGLMAVADIDGTACTIYALANYALYSVYKDVEDMKRANRDARLARRGKAE